MIVFARGEVRTWSDLTPGALFGVSIRGETHLGVKIQGSRNEFHCAVLSGLPPHYVRENLVQNSLLYFFHQPGADWWARSYCILHPKPRRLDTGK
jgi:hypothetical protein